KGPKAISFSENPTKLGYPSIHDLDGYWHPVLQAANDARLPLCIHFGSSSSMPTTSPDAPLLVWATLAPVNLMFALTDWLFAGLLPKYPDLKICLSEGGIGWIPYMLERSDWEARDMRWASKGNFKYDMAKAGSIPELRPEYARQFDEPPSELFKKHVYGCFIDDAFGSRHIEEVGVDNVMIETDFPHGDTTFPNSIANAHERLAGKSDELKLKVMQDNAIRVFDFEPAPIPTTTGSR
ncbi:MAG TPA: amidohydrolase family protein, partial [Iamia sp.]|nr:amidohydrolase family protein [Iamia sp.]